MKYIHLLVSSLVLSFCSCSETFDDSRKESKSSSETINISEKASFSVLSIDMLLYLNNFLGFRDQFCLKNVNRFTRDSLNLKERVMHLFHIYGLESFDDNEPELAGVMRLAWTSNDPFLFFAALFEDVSGEKRPYKVILRPLVLHLARTFYALDSQYKEKFYRHRFYDRYLAKICCKKGHFDFVFEFSRGHPQLLRELISGFENRNELIEIFRANSQYARQYLDALLTDECNKCWYSIEERFGRWIAECIINNFPQSYYEELFDFDPKYLEILFNQLIISSNIPESEYSRIYSLLVNIFEKYSDALAKIRNFTIIRMIIDVRFGSLELVSFQDKNLESLDFKLKCLLIKAALLANKNFLFLCEERDFNRILEFQNLNVNDVQAKNFKVVFEIIKSNTDIFENEFSLFSFVTKFYAVKHLKLEGNSVAFYCSVSGNLLEFGFPPEFRFEFDKFLQIFVNMKVFNETGITTFIPDLIYYLNNRLRQGIIVSPSYEFIEFISNSPNLLNSMVKNGIKLEINGDIEIFEKYFNLDNFELTNQLIKWSGFSDWIFTELKTQDHLEKMEIILNFTVSHYFLPWESDFNINRRGKSAELIYLEWRSIFAIWIKRSDKGRIKEIQTPEFIKLLKLDFPDETRELFDSHQH
jgi:hypothetical protein